jgi:hypothetical protein
MSYLFIKNCQPCCQALVSGLLLPRILSDGSKQRPAAADLGFGYLTATGEDKRNSLGLLTRLNVSLGLDYRRINGLALLGWRYCVLSGLPKPAEQFSQLYVKAAWGRRTADMGVCFKGLCHKIYCKWKVLDISIKIAIGFQMGSVFFAKLGGENLLRSNTVLRTGVSKR